jgi:hypothetical protein
MQVGTNISCIPKTKNINKSTSSAIYIELCRNYCCKEGNNIPAIAGFRRGAIEVLEKDRASVHITTRGYWDCGGRITNDAGVKEVKLENGGEV